MGGFPMYRPIAPSTDVESARTLSAVPHDGGMVAAANQVMDYLHLGEEEESAKKGDRLDVKVVEEDDYVSPITVETYVLYRVFPLLQNFQKEAPVLSKWLSYLENLGFLVTATGTFLGAYEQHTWVAFVVAVYTVVNNAIQYLVLQSRLTATNSAVRDL